VINQRNEARIQEEEEAKIKKERRKKAEREYGGARVIDQYASKTVLISSKQCLNSKIAILIKP
jgi:hypothetical protein